MFAKSFIALDGNGRLTGARTAQTAPYDRYTCHLCGRVLQYQPEYKTKRPWFEHRRGERATALPIHHAGSERDTADKTTTMLCTGCQSDGLPEQLAL